MPTERSPLATLPPLLFVTGAPGAGKSSIAGALLRTPSEVLIFDIDWLTLPVSALVGQSIIEASHLWPRYNRLWLAILEMVVRNGRPAVLFTPWGRGDVAALPAIAGVDPHGWCLLDCDDATRVARLRARGWTGAMIEEAVADAGALRGQIDFVVDTSRTTPDEAAAHVDGWLVTRWPREARR